MAANQSDHLRQLDEIESRIVKLGNELRQAEQERAELVRRLIVVRGRYERPDVSHSTKLLLTAEEAAKMLSISEKTATRLIKRGELRAVKIGPRGVRIGVDAIRQWIERQEVKNTDSSGCH